MANHTISKESSAYAAKFGVHLEIERYGIFGSEWDYVASPEKPDWYPMAGSARTPIGADPKSIVRIIAERMGTGRCGPTGFCVTRAAPSTGHGAIKGAG